MAKTRKRTPKAVEAWVRKPLTGSARVLMVTDEAAAQARRRFPWRRKFGGWYCYVRIVPVRRLQQEKGAARLRAAAPPDKKNLTGQGGRT